MLFQLVEGLVELQPRAAFRVDQRRIGEEFGGKAGFDFVAGCVPFLFLRILLGVAEPAEGSRLQHLEKRIRRRRLVVRGLKRFSLSTPALPAVRKILNISAVGEHDRLEHLVFGDLLAEALDHQDRLFAARDDQVERALFHFGLRRQHDEAAVDHADPHGRDRMIERNRCDAQRRTGSRRRMHVGVIFRIAGQDVGHDLNFVRKPCRKQGTQRPVGEPSA